MTSLTLGPTVVSSQGGTLEEIELILLRRGDLFSRSLLLSFLQEAEEDVDPDLLGPLCMKNIGPS